jgi:hypothetical protein
MRQVLSLTAAVAVLLGVALSARADNAADAKALVDKATKAHGGADNIGKVKAAIMTAKGKYYGMGDQGVDFTLRVAFQAPDKQRLIVEGQGFKVTQVFNKDKGWIALNDNVIEYDKDALEEAKESVHATSITQLNPAVLKDAKLETIGEVKVNDKPALGVRVESKGYRPVTLYFDKETNLLVKSERRAKDVQAGGSEFNEETYYREWKEVNGVKRAHKIQINRDDKKYVESETTEFKVVDKLDDAEFAKP